MAAKPRRRNLAQVIRESGRRSVHLPVLDLDVEIMALRGYELLQAGVMPLLYADPELLSGEEMEDAADRAVEVMHRILSICCVNPRYVPEDADPEANEISGADLANEDLAYLYEQIVDLSDSRYAGIDQRLADDLGEGWLIDQDNCTLVYGKMAQAFGVLPHELLYASHDELAYDYVVFKRLLEEQKAKEKSGS